SRVIEVAMTDYDRVQRREVDLALSVGDDRARTWVEANARVALFDEEAGRRGNLPCDHEPRAGGPHEREPHLPTVWGGRPHSGRVGGIKSRQPPTAGSPTSRRSTGRTARRPARGCRSPPPACHRGSGRCVGTVARTRSGAAPSAGSSRRQPRARPRAAPCAYAPGPRSSSVEITA